MDKLNQILFQYWNHEISQEEMRKMLVRISPDELTDWIDEISNRIPGVMAFVCHSQY